LLPYDYECGLEKWLLNHINPDNYKIKGSGRKKIDFSYELIQRRHIDEKVTVFLKIKEDGDRLFNAMNIAIRKFNQDVEKQKKINQNIPLNEIKKQEQNIDFTKRAIDL
jgi:hypothetical protein